MMNIIVFVQLKEVVSSSTSLRISICKSQNEHPGEMIWRPLVFHVERDTTLDSLDGLCAGVQFPPRPITSALERARLIRAW
jgi:hypothetical protein